MPAELVAHALLRGASPLSTNLGSGSPLFPTVCAEVCGKCRHGTQECSHCLRHKNCNESHVFLANFAGRGACFRGCVRHLRHLFFPTICSEVSGKCGHSTGNLESACGR